MNWREVLRGAVAEVEYAKDAKARTQADTDSLLHLLHTDFRGATKTEQPPSDEQASAVLPDASGIPWAEWKAAALNRLFREQGVTGQPGRITAETVRHGERHRGQR
jgi:hypothetical protein